MFRITSLFIISLLYLSFAYQDDYSGYKVYQIVPNNEDELKTIQILIKHPQMDVWTSSKLIGHPTVFMVPPTIDYRLRSSLRVNNLPYDTLIEDVQSTVVNEKHEQAAARRIASKQNGLLTFKQYERFDTITWFLRNLTNLYPDIVQLINIGKSYEGRDLEVLKISSGGNEDKPAIFIDGGMHAREWISPATVLYIISQLVENYSENSALTDNIDWYIIPVINPDGYEYTHTMSRFWRKTRSVNLNTYCRGTDPNRNFDFHWNEVGASSDPCDEIFAGSDAFSERETDALSNFVLGVKQNIKLYLTFHSYETVARRANAVANKRYTVGSSTNVLYSAAGGSDDWFKGVAGVNLSYTIELPGGGLSGFDLPPSRIDEVVQETFEMVKVFAGYIQEKFLYNRFLLH
ncbi:carboxypeptidase B-like isoform X2 [Chrysoperla carnea]|uniref:carboxypeptidase B-like isoform X2 n=1 Tax=Chrysoperla carnea TaxID=189513 RepID=UPI001D07D542|nr:carboxypeptidase B-like isoform X2 [Chrysoperla carnea]